MSFEFTYDNYSNLLMEMKKIANIYSFSQLNSTVNNGFILRHDVDFDLLHAFRMSQYECASNVSSTYFILTTSEQYNVNSKENRVLLNQISQTSDVGLHFDPTVYTYNNYEELSKFVDYEVSIIENIIGKNVTSISLHNPSIHNEYPIFNGFVNAYQPEYFNLDLYISDSSKNFRGKDIFKFIEKGTNNILQVLIHPIHYSINERKYSDAFLEIYKKNIDNLDLLMKLNNQYNNEMNEMQLFDYITRRGIVYD